MDHRTLTAPRTTPDAHIEELAAKFEANSSESAGELGMPEVWEDFAPPCAASSSKSALSLSRLTESAVPGHASRPPAWSQLPGVPDVGRR